MPKRIPVATMALTPEQAARELQVHVRTVQARCLMGEIPATKVGRRWRIGRAALERYLAGERR